MSENQLFVVSREVWRAFDEEELNATTNALKELGLYRLPYEEVDLEIPFHAQLDDADLQERMAEAEEKGGREAAILKMAYSDRSRLRITNLSVDGPLPNAEAISPNGGRIPFFVGTLRTVSGRTRDGAGLNGLGLQPSFWRDLWCGVLIVLLSVRNIKKTLKVSKLAKLGIGKPRSTYATTLSLPLASEMPDDPEHPPKPGRPVSPHLRRGHIRNQRYGPKNELVKRIWIAPILVHSDADFVRQRERYNVTPGAERLLKQASA